MSSIVGRFLEHSRLYYFENGGDEEMYTGSADLMPRNLDRRVELLFPINDPEIRRRLKDVVLERYLSDARKVRIGQPDGTYTTPPANGNGFDSQSWFVKNRRKLSDQ